MLLLSGRLRPQRSPPTMFENYVRAPSLPGTSLPAGQNRAPRSHINARRHAHCYLECLVCLLRAMRANLSAARHPWRNATQRTCRGRPNQALACRCGRSKRLSRCTPPPLAVRADEHVQPAACWVWDNTTNIAIISPKDIELLT